MIEVNVVNLKGNVQQELWEAIEKNYENESYSSAILDTIHLLTETIRNKTGLEGDGSSLIGQAFGGDNPKIQLNKLQTESEKNVQKGIQDILRGLFTAIRNPRSHDKHSDTKVDADAIIVFIDYLLRMIDKSRLNFEESTFLERVFDEYYVRSNEYSDLLVSEIPKRKRLNIATAVILRRNERYIENITYFMRAIINKLEDNEIQQLYKLVSEELKVANSEAEIRTFLRIMPPSDWLRIDQIVRMRIENILFANVESGKYSTQTDNCRFGALGTWIEDDHLLCFQNKSKWTAMIVRKMKSDDEEEKSYAEEYFWHKICRINYDDISYPLRNYFGKGLFMNDEKIIELLSDELRYTKDHPWWKVFEEQLIAYPEIKYEEVELPF